MEPTKFDSLNEALEALEETDKEGAAVYLGGPVMYGALYALLEFSKTRVRDLGVLEASMRAIHQTVERVLGLVTQTGHIVLAPKCLKHFGGEATCKDCIPILPDLLDDVQTWWCPVCNAVVSRDKQHILG